MDTLERSIAYRETADDIIKTAEGLVESKECSDMAIAILASLLCKMGFSEDRAVAAATNRHSIEGALRYLKTAMFMKCNVCTREMEPFMMFRLTPCGHELCKSCCRSFFSTKVRNDPVLHMTCFVCTVEIDVGSMYQQLKNILDDRDYMLLDKKLLDASLMQDNYRHCPKCTVGFIVHPELQRPLCPECKTIVCGKCWLVWEDQHKNTSCDDFRRWKQENEPEFQEAQVEHILNSEGIVCPKCHHRYSFARGGCLHCTCTKCKYEFCSCCKSQFSKGEECRVGSECSNKGLHAHHPRNCFYHVRDYPVDQLINLIKEAGHEVDETPAEANIHCTTKTTDNSMQDIPCNGNVYKAEKCEKHFMEYLGEIISNNNIDTVTLMNEDQLKRELAKNGKQIPEKHPSEDNDTYCGRLREIITESLPIRQEAE